MCVCECVCACIGVCACATGISLICMCMQVCICMHVYDTLLYILVFIPICNGYMDIVAITPIPEAAAAFRSLGARIRCALCAGKILLINYS